MNENTYAKITKLIYNHKYGPQILRGINNITVILVYCLYSILLMILAYNHDARFWRVLLTPGISFVLVSIFRKVFNASRPYEVLNIDSIIKKDTKGKSFPSRHVFSIFVISTAFYYILPPMGVVLMFLGILLALARVLGGVHFPRDVIAGAIIGILSGTIGFTLL